MARGPDEGHGEEFAPSPRRLPLSSRPVSDRLCLYSVDSSWLRVWMTGHSAADFPPLKRPAVPALEGKILLSITLPKRDWLLRLPVLG